MYPRPPRRPHTVIVVVVAILRTSSSSRRRRTFEHTSQVTEELAAFLEQNLPKVKKKKAKFTLGVLDVGFAQAIQAGWMMQSAAGAVSSVVLLLFFASEPPVVAPPSPARGHGAARSTPLAAERAARSEVEGAPQRRRFD